MYIYYYCYIYYYYLLLLWYLLLLLYLLSVYARWGSFHKFHMKWPLM